MGKLNMNKAQSKAADLQKSGGNADFDKLQSGKNVRRVLPPKGDKDVFWAEGYLHFGLGEDGKTTATCLETYGQGKKCPICQYVEQLKQSKNKADRKLAEDIKRTKRTYIAVINRDSDDEEDKPVVLSVGKTILQPIIDLICDPDYGDITDFNEGRDITITKSGKGMGTEYSVIAKPKTSIATEDLTEEELDEAIPDLESMFVKRSAEELQAILDGVDLEDDSDDDDDTSIDYDELELDDLEALCEERDIKLPPKPTKLKLISLLERYDEAEAEEEEKPAKPKSKSTKNEEEEKPAKPKSKTKTKPEPEEEPEEESEEESEEEPDEDELQAEISKAIKSRKSGKK